MDAQAPMNIEEVDKKFVFHPFTNLHEHEQNGPLMIVEGHGSTLTDANGRTYLDAMAGLWCVNIGYGNREMAETMRAQCEKLPYYHSFASVGSEPVAILAQRLIEMAPVPMSKVFFGNSGSDANDTQIKLVWYYNNILGRPQKKKIISRSRGYHGVTIMSAGLTGLPGMHAGFDLPLPMIRHVRAPHRLWEKETGTSDEAFVQSLAQELEQLILDEGPETVAAFIAEPIQAAGGVIVPPDGYFQAVQAVLKKYDILLIADEVVCGFGRAGDTFGSKVVNMEPDLITLAKGITSAYIPLSACMVSAKIWDVLTSGSARYGVFSHGYTYSAHPLAAAAALTNLDIIEREGLAAQAKARGDYLAERLRAEFGGHPLVGEIRGRGLLGAVEFVQSTSPLTAFDPALGIGAAVARRSRDLGVMTRALPSADTISFSPPFVVTESEIDEMAAVTRRALDNVAEERRLIL